MIELTDEQRRAVDAGGAVPVHEGASTYYIVSGERFAEIEPLLDVRQADRSLYEAGEIDLFGDVEKPQAVTNDEAERIVRRSQGMLRWTGDVETLRRIAEDPEFDWLEQ